jgi:hypothetical protein
MQDESQRFLGNAVAKLLWCATAARRGARATGYEFHKGQFSAYIAALGLLGKELPHALSFAVEVLNEDAVDPACARFGEVRVAEMTQLADQLRANLGKGPCHLYDDILAEDLKSGEPVARAQRANDDLGHQSPRAAEETILPFDRIEPIVIRSTAD